MNHGLTHPRSDETHPYIGSSPITIMWSRMTSVTGLSGSFSPNHFLPVYVRSRDAQEAQMSKPSDNDVMVKPTKMMKLDGKGICGE